MPTIILSELIPEENGNSVAVASCQYEMSSYHKGGQLIAGVQKHKSFRETPEYKEHKIFLRFVFSIDVPTVRTEES